VHRIQRFSLQNRWKLGLFLVTAGVVFVFDQLSKLWVQANLVRTDLVPGFVSLVRVENYGSAFGLFTNQAFLISATAIVISLLVLLFLHPLTRNISLTLAMSFGLIFGGAVGNLIDRIRLGYVTDFIDIHLLELFHWPAFNIADASITVGTFISIVFLYKSRLFRKAYGHGSRSRS
jgi:signal peptidase II